MQKDGGSATPLSQVSENSHHTVQPAEVSHYANLRCGEAFPGQSFHRCPLVVSNLKQYCSAT